MADSPEREGFLGDPKELKKKGVLLMGVGLLGGLLIPALATVALAAFVAGGVMAIYGHSKMKK